MVVPCGDGNMKVFSLIQQAVTRYKKAIAKVRGAGSGARDQYGASRSGEGSEGESPGCPAAALGAGPGATGGGRARTLRGACARRRRGEPDGRRAGGGRPLRGSQRGPSAAPRGRGRLAGLGPLFADVWRGGGGPRGCRCGERPSLAGKGARGLAVPGLPRGGRWGRGAAGRAGVAAEGWKSIPRLPGPPGPAGRAVRRDPAAGAPRGPPPPHRTRVRGAPERHGRPRSFRACSAPGGLRGKAPPGREAPAVPRGAGIAARPAAGPIPSAACAGLPHPHVEMPGCGCAGSCTLGFPSTGDLLGFGFFLSLFFFGFCFSLFFSLYFLLVAANFSLIKWFVGIL